MDTAPPDRPCPGPPLLAADEPRAFEVVNAEGRSSAVLVCDHASNRVPRRLVGLGLDARALADHIAWDPGAADVARRLAALLDAPLVLSGYSRLVIDCNRPPQSPQSIAGTSDGIVVPGNQGLSAEARAERRRVLFEPYHDAIRRLLDRRAGRPSRLLSLHSFTPSLAGEVRPWPIAVAYRHDRGLGGRLRQALLDLDPELLVGDNQPYAISDDSDYTIPTHGEARALPNVLIEIRQDGVATPAGAAAWATLLAATYTRIERDALRLCGS